MKGGGSPRPVSPAAAPSSAKLGAKGTGTKSSGAKAENDDLPFEIENRANEPAAIPVLPTPGKARPLAVVCPMCDKPGYVPASAAGKSVKCWNPRCSLPVFVAEPPPPEPEVKPLAPKSNLVLVGLWTAVPLLIIGGLLYWWSSLPTNSGLVVEKGKIDEESLALIRESAGDGGPANPVMPGSVGAEKGTGGSTSVATGTNGSANPTAVEPAGNEPGGPELIGKAVGWIPELVLAPQKQNRSKPMSRQLAAEILAVAGRTAEAKDQLASLDKVGADVPYYKILTLVEIGWNELQAGKKSAAETASTAASFAGRLPTVGRKQAVVAGRLAALLVATKNSAGAEKALEGHSAAWELGSALGGEAQDRAAAEEGLLAGLQQIAIDRGDYDIRGDWAARSIFPASDPQRAAVVASLVHRGQSNLAVQWILDQPGSVTDLWLAWAYATGRQNKGASAAQTKLKELAAVDAVAALSQLARGLYLAGDKEGAAKTVEMAAAKAEQLPTAAAFTVPGTADLMKLSVNRQSGTESQALAFGNLLLAQLVVGDQAGAGTSLSKGLQALEAAGPKGEQIADLFALAESPNPQAIRDKLKTELSLKSDDDVRLAVNKFRGIVRELEKLSRIRAELLGHLLGRAAEAGLATAVADQLLDPAFADPAIWTEGTVLLVLEACRQNSPEKEGPLAARWQEMSGGMNVPVSAAATWEALWKQGEVEQLAGFLAETGRDGAEKSRLLLFAAAAAQTPSEIKKLFSVLKSLSDQQIPLREEVCQFSGVAAARAGQAGAIWKLAQEGTTQSTERLALLRGMVTGLKVK